MRVDRCGIYWIVSQRTGKIYVGSSVAVYRRWKEHRRDLSRGTHINYRLQTAHNEGDTFLWTLVEDLSEEQLDIECLRLIEQWYILMYRPAFNIVHNVFSHLLDLNVKRWVVCSPGGQEEEIVNLEAYCRDRGIAPQNLIKVAQGKIRQHKGYRCRRPEDAEYRFKPKPRLHCHVAEQNIRHWQITHPTGQTEEVQGLSAFCRQYQLDPSGFSKAADNGKTYRGYSVVRLGPRRLYSTRPSPSDALPIP